MAAYARLGRWDIIEAHVALPRLGAWTALLRVDTDKRPAGRIRLHLGGASLLGAVKSATVYTGVAHVKLVGGNGGLATQLQAKGYISAPVKVPLQDIANEAGEVLSAVSDSTVLLHQLRHWMRLAGPAGHSLGVLVADVPGAAWRFQPDGSLWVGQEGWPESRLAAEATAFEPWADALSFYSEAPALQPGTRFLGRKVRYVEHRVSEASIRSRALFEARP